MKQASALVRLIPLVPVPILLAGALLIALFVLLVLLSRPTVWVALLTVLVIVLISHDYILYI